MTAAESKLAQANTPTRWLMSSTVVLSIVYWVILTVIGRISALFIDVYRAFNVPPSWPIALANGTQLRWTLPFALVVTGLLIWKDRSCVRTTALRLNKAAFGLLFLFSLIWLFVISSPIFAMHEIPPN